MYGRRIILYLYRKTKRQEASTPAFQTAPASTSEYSLSTPGSMSDAWPRMRKSEEPKTQKSTLKGEAHQTSGMPTTNRMV